jgi:O-antigen/teichoic acid export membrane protein
MSLGRQSRDAAVAAIVTSAARMFLVAILARRLVPASFGQFVYAQWLVDISILVCSFGAPAAASRYAAEFGRDPALLSGFLRRWCGWAAGASVAAAVGTVAAIWLSGLQLGPAGYACLFAWSAAQGLWTMQTATLAGCQRFDVISQANIVFAAVIGAGVWLLPIAEPPPALLFALMASAVAAAACVGLFTVIRRTRVSPAPPDRAQWHSIHNYASNMWVTALLTSLVWSRGEYPLVRGVLGDEGLARYAAPMALFAGGVQLVMLATAGVAPYLTDLWGRGRREPAVVLAGRIVNLQLLGCGIVALTLTFLDGALLELVFGPAYRDGQRVLPILSLALVGLALSAPNHLVQLATDGRFNRNVIVVGVALLFIFALLLVPTAGIPGAALARASTMIVVALATGTLAIRLFGATLVPVRNFGVVTAVVLGAMVLVMLFPDFNLRGRILFLFGTVLILAVTLRSDDGTFFILTTARRVGLFRTPQAERV